MFTIKGYYRTILEEPTLILRFIPQMAAFQK